MEYLPYVLAAYGFGLVLSVISGSVGNYHYGWGVGFAMLFTLGLVAALIFGALIGADYLNGQHVELGTYEHIAWTYVLPVILVLWVIRSYIVWGNPDYA